MADFEPRSHVPRVGAPAGHARELPAEAFPGCTRRRVPRSEIDTWEGRLEFWDAATEIAWVAEPTTPYHEKPSRRLTALMDRIAAERGSAIACYGHRSAGDPAPRPPRSHARAAGLNPPGCSISAWGHALERDTAGAPLTCHSTIMRP